MAAFLTKSFIKRGQVLRVLRAPLTNNKACCGGLNNLAAFNSKPSSLQSLRLFTHQSSSFTSSRSNGNNGTVNDDPITFREWLKSLEIEGMDENKLNEFEKKEDVLTDMAQRGDPNNDIRAFAKSRGLTDEFVQGEIQNRMLSKYQPSEQAHLSMIEVWESDDAESKRHGVESLIDELESLSFTQNNRKHTLCVEGNKSRIYFVKELYRRAEYVAHGTGIGMIESSIMSGGPGNGKTILSRAVASLLPNYFDNLICIYLSLKDIEKDMKSLSIFDILAEYNPNNKRVMILIDEIHIAYFEESEYGQKFIDSLSVCIERGGVSVNFIGTAGISASLLRHSDHELINEYQRSFNCKFSISDKTIINGRRLELLPTLTNWHSRESFAKLYSFMVFNKSVTKQQLLDIPAFNDALKWSYWLCGGNPNKLQQIIDGNADLLIQNINNDIFNILEEDKYFREISQIIANKQSNNFPSTFDQQYIKSFDVFNMTGYPLLGFEYGKMRNCAIIYHEKLFLHIDDDDVYLGYPLSAIIIKEYDQGNYFSVQKIVELSYLTKLSYHHHVIPLS